MDGYKKGLQSNNPKVEQLRKDIENYQLKLDMLGFTDADVAREKKKKKGRKGAKSIWTNYLIFYPLGIKLMNPLFTHF
jgi:hypothetical protein